MSYNPQDPYDAAAWWFMQLCCSGCGTMLDLDLKSPHPDSDNYWHEYGQRAKQSGWHIAEQSISPPEWLILCPVLREEENEFESLTCARRHQEIEKAPCLHQET